MGEVVTDMTLILEKTFPRTLDRLVADYANEDWRGARLEAWLFEDATARQTSQEKFARAGVTAKFYSAYKPLIHFFLEEAIARGPFQHIEIIYPVDNVAPELRFLLEAYPLAGMVGDAEIVFTAAEPGGEHEYEVVLTAPNDVVVRRTVFAPNRISVDHAGDTVLSPCGWLRVTHPDGRMIDTALETDYEQLFHEVMQAIKAHPWADTLPLFEALHIAVSLTGSDTRLPVGEEAISLHEALHEEFYFSLNELFQKRSGRSSGARNLPFGQVIPKIQAQDGPISVRIETRPWSNEDTDWPTQPLHDATGPFSPAQIDAVLDGIGGEAFAVTSRAGRAVPARYVRGADWPVMISGGQHANETSGVVGALRGASLLAKREGAHFTVAPLENPDGYALHWRLCQSQPHHMHHAARYTALGDDLEYREAEPLYEKGIRVESYKRTKAILHVNLHGYPAHEWTRPLTGYIPRNFALWTIPKGFFLIVRYHTGWAERSRRLLERVTTGLRHVPGLVTFHERQIHLCEIHSGPFPFEILNGFPCLVSEDNRYSTPLTLITEYPDETIYGEAFRLAQETQTRAVVAAYDALQEMMAQTEAV